MTLSRTDEPRYYGQVYKSNSLIQMAQYTLTHNEMRLLVYLISKISRGDNVNKKYQITIQEAADVMNVDINSGGTYYKFMRDAVKKLCLREWGIMPGGKMSTISWLLDAEVAPGQGVIDFYFHPKMQPFLFDIKEKYTQYKLSEILSMETSAAMRLFELMKSVCIKNKGLDGQYVIKRTIREYSLDDLRLQLGIQDKYPKWSDLDRYAIRKSVDNINSISEEMHVEYMPVKTGRSVTSVRFIIDAPDAEQLLLVQETMAKRENRKQNSKASAQKSARRASNTSMATYSEKPDELFYILTDNEEDTEALKDWLSDLPK